MVLESWETKFGMVVLHGNVKKNSELAFLFCIFRASVKVKVAGKIPKIVKITP